MSPVTAVHDSPDSFSRLPHHTVFPHHYVLKEDSLTTKLRVVFDGTAAASSVYSLKDVLLPVSVIRSKLLQILVRFRCHRVAIKGNIYKLFRQSFP